MKIKYNNKSNQLVIGGYSYKNPQLKTNKGGIKIFIETLKKVNKDCCIIVICHINNKSNILEEFLNKNEVNIIYHNFIELHYDDRFLIIYKILLSFKNFENILISDMNDVMFQNDPFIIENDKLYCPCEESNITDNNFCGKINMKWISQFYNLFKINTNLYEKYKNKKILCCGTIIGNYNSIIKYLSWYYNILTKKSPIRIVGQGLFNIYCYQNEKDVFIINQKYGKILTCGNVKYNMIKTNSKGKLLNDNDEEYVIIHQMDRWGIEKINLLEKNILY
jgi:hypothetical protein